MGVSESTRLLYRIREGIAMRCTCTGSYRMFVQLFAMLVLVDSSRLPLLLFAGIVPARMCALVSARACTDRLRGGRHVWPTPEEGDGERGALHGMGVTGA